MPDSSSPPKTKHLKQEDTGKRLKDGNEGTAVQVGHSESLAVSLLPLVQNKIMKHLSQPVIIYSVNVGGWGGAFAVGMPKGSSGLPRQLLAALQQAIPNIY